MAETYKIAQVSSGVRDVTLDSGTFKSYRFRCEGKGDTIFSLLQKPDTAPPKAGDTFEATVKNIFNNDDGSSVTNLKKVQQQRNGGGPRYTAEDIARMEAVGRVKGRCHAQGVAVQMLAPELPNVNFNDADQANAFLNGVFAPLVDFLVKDANTARKQPTEGN